MSYTCETCGRNYDNYDHYNSECDDCCNTALSWYVDALNEFIEDPQHWFEEDHPVDGMYRLTDLMTYEYNMAKFCEEWDVVNGSWHDSMYDIVYSVESRWRAGYAVSIDDIKSYRDKMTLNLQQAEHKEQ